MRRVNIDCRVANQLFEGSTHLWQGYFSGESRLQRVWRRDQSLGYQQRPRAYGRASWLLPRDALASAAARRHLVALVHRQSRAGSSVVRTWLRRVARGSSWWSELGRAIVTDFEFD